MENNTNKIKPTLLILAAGMGSRYGSLKQMDTLGPNGETIMDYSINDAIEAGFGKVVFVIRKSMEADFQRFILSKYEAKIAVDYRFQELDMLPTGFTQNPDREKPYGTAHAIFAAKEAIHEPFAVINADDFYSKEAFKTMAQFLSKPVQADERPNFAMIGYKLANTLSEYGTVSRGVCTTDLAQNLCSITEMTKIQRYPDNIKNENPDGTFTVLTPNTPVSMNFWGFSPLFFDYLEQLFIEFLTQNNDNPASEFAIPTAINYFLTHKIASFKVLSCDAEWFGVTYQADRVGVVEKLKQLDNKSEKARTTEFLLIQLRKKQLWDEMPVFSFTSDVDWASEDVLAQYFDIVNALDIKPMLFCTHHSPTIEAQFQQGKIERGIHPNFLNGSSQGDNFKEIADTCVKFAPEAYGFRSHRCFDVTDITHLLKNEYGYKYVSNLATIMQSHIRPVLHESGLIHFPIFFEDGTHLYNELDLDFTKYKEAFTSSGLKVICFHPMNFVFNTPKMAYMRQIKDSLSREAFNHITTETIEQLKNRIFGIQNTILAIIDFVKTNNYPILSLNEIYKNTVSQ
jgi:UTP-glucose-1-phosphate uridylyltransferase